MRFIPRTARPGGEGLGDSRALGQVQVVRELGLSHWMYLYSVVHHASASIDHTRIILKPLR
jgi:hypothetical protein